MSPASPEHPAADSPASSRSPFPSLALTALIVAVFSLGIGVSALRRAGQLEARLQALEQPKHFPLGEAMGYLQRYAEKLYFAGQAQNWELADFYLHEVTETSDDIIGANIADEGVEVSKLMATILPPAEKGLQEAVAAKDSGRFRTRYAALVAACNACHQDTKHGFMKITIPERPSVTNQSFAP